MYKLFKNIKIYINKYTCKYTSVLTCIYNKYTCT